MENTVSQTRDETMTIATAAVKFDVYLIEIVPSMMSAGELIITAEKHEDRESAESAREMSRKFDAAMGDRHEYVIAAVQDVTELHEIAKTIRDLKKN